jgi:chloramphenicol O-acetyltransferase type B
MASLPFTRIFLQSQISSGFRIQVGPHTYGHPRILWNEAQKTQYSLRIGDYCSIAEGVIIYVGAQGRHPIDFASSFPLRALFPPNDAPKKLSRLIDRNLDVAIGSDVWLGREALILAGVTVGHGAVVGTRAVVTKNVAPYTIVGGVPARPIGMRFPPHIVAALLDLAWWELPPDVVAANVDAFLSADIEAFLDVLRDAKARARTAPGVV